MSTVPLGDQSQTTLTNDDDYVKEHAPEALLVFIDALGGTSNAENGWDYAQAMDRAAFYLATTVYLTLYPNHWVHVHSCGIQYPITVRNATKSFEDAAISLSL